MMQKTPIKRRRFHIYGSLTSRKGSEVSLRPPGDVKEAGGSWIVGVLVDEIWATPEINDSPPRPTTGANDWGDYSFCAQKIRLSDCSSMIRLAYYRRRAGEDGWQYASQMTVAADTDTIKALLQETLEQKDWFERAR